MAGVRTRGSVVFDHTEGHTYSTASSDHLLQTITWMLQAQTVAMEAQSHAVSSW